MPTNRGNRQSHKFSLTIWWLKSLEQQVLAGMRVMMSGLLVNVNSFRWRKSNNPCMSGFLCYYSWLRLQRKQPCIPIRNRTSQKVIRRIKSLSIKDMSFLCFIQWYSTEGTVSIQKLLPATILEASWIQRSLERIRKEQIFKLRQQSLLFNPFETEVRSN